MKGYLLGALAAVVLVVPARGTANEIVPRLSLAVSEEYNDNVFLSDTDRKSDFITRISPRLDLSFRAPKASLTLGYSPSFNIYSSHSERNSTSQRFNSQASLQPSERLSLGVNASFLKSEEVAEQREVLVVDPGALRQNRELTTTTVGAQLSYKLSPTLQPTLGASYTNTDYQGGVVDDSETYAATFSLAYTLGARSTLSVGAKHTLFDYQGPIDATTQEYTLGLSYKLTPTLTAAASGGITFTDIDGISGNKTNFSGGVSLTHQGERGSAVLGVSQAVISSITEAEPQRSRTVSLRLTRQLAEKWNAGASLSYSTYKSVASSFRAARSRNTEALHAGADLSYTLGPWARASLAYRYIDSNEKENNLGSYYNHIVVFSLNVFYDRSVPF